MATNAKIIKLGNGSTTYIPITSTQAIQHSYGSEKVVLDAYLGGLHADIEKNAGNISILAGGVLQAKANLDDLNAYFADYKKSYVKAGESANQISYNLPNGTRGVITINDVEHAVTATNLAAAPVLTKTAATGDNADSFTVTAGGKTSTPVSLSKASDTAYGVAKVDSNVSSDSENPIQNKAIKKYADDTFVTKEAFNTFSASGMHYKGDTATIPTSPASGDVYHVTAKITSGLGDGVTAEVGDFITYYKPSVGDGKWSVWDKNVDGAIYSGNNTLVSGQMLVTDGVSGKVKSQAIPTVSVSGTGSGNFVKSISKDGHGITYTMGYAVDTLEKNGTNSTGVITNVTKSNNTLTVTYTDLTTDDPGAGAATNAVSVTYIATIAQAADGKITATKGTVNISTMKGASTTAAGAVGLVPAPAQMKSGETVKVLGADGQWKTVAATVANTNQTLTNKIKYAESDKTVDIDESLFGTFATVGDIVTINTTTPTVSVTVS